MKRIPTIILTCLLVLSFAVYVWARAERTKVEYYDKQTFKSNTEHQKDMKFGENATITSEKNLYPENFIKNSQLGIWSGGTRWGHNSTGDINAVPDGWYIPSTSTYTGVTRIGVSTVSPVSSVTPPFTHSMYINSWDGTNASAQNGNTKFVLYPDSGVSAQAWWYQKFAGRSVTFGAWVNRSVAQAVASGVTTNFIRPVMNSHSVHLSACSTYWKLGDFIEDNGWTLATVTWDVPATASAFECGFAMNPTILSANKSGNSGDSAYVVAPFLLVNPLHKAYVPNPKEEIFFLNTVNPFGAYVSGGSTFGAGTGGSLDLSANNGWGGKIPDDVSRIYATVSVNASWPYSLYMYGDNVLGGVSFYGLQSGVSPQATTTWIPVGSNGNINIANPSTNFSGVSFFVHGAKMR